ncbi:MAG: L,D-transpeptidase family protein [Pseudomonadota bacterium]
MIAPFRRLLTAALVFFALSMPGLAQVTAFKQIVAEEAASDPALASFYQTRAYAPIWTGASDADRARRAALLAALGTAEAHGLPAALHDPDTLRSRMAAARTSADLAQLEVHMSAVFLAFARDIQTGVLTPGAVDSEIKREVPLRDGLQTLISFTAADPDAFMRALPPSSSEYTRLLKMKRMLESGIARGGWGPAVTARSLKPGESGAAVVQLRNRLIAMGYLPRTMTQTYDASIEAAVTRFQESHGMAEDGVAGAGTMAMINQTMADRLAQVLVALERERWINHEAGLGERHIWVNLTDFSAQIRDRGVVTFQTRSVIGAHDEDRRSPEFSDVMEHMVINPSWYVPRSIATKEYLPQLKRNPYAVGHLEITDARGRVVNRGAVDFTQYTERSFPFNMRQPPSKSNALGLVKFMFPNRYNIYLHDTPAKSLFGREVRAFSHGCIRLNDPFDFAYALLALQTDDPEGFFRARLNTGKEAKVDLEQQVPVHLVYRTAFTTPTGELRFRRDVYGRDARIWQALRREGVVLGGVQG